VSAYYWRWWRHDERATDWHWYKYYPSTSGVHSINTNRHLYAASFMIRSTFCFLTHHTQLPPQIFL
jgi:hypothetical protein